jgi:membrane-associated phospholipid phosphatase
MVHCHQAVGTAPDERECDEGENGPDHSVFIGSVPCRKGPGTTLLDEECPHAPGLLEFETLDDAISRMTTVALAIVATMLAPRMAPADPVSAGGSIGRSIGRHLKDDLRGMISGPSLVILGTGATVAFAVSPKDREVTQSVAGADTLEEALDPGNGIGNGYIQFATAAGTWAIGRATHHPVLAATGVDLIEAQLLNGAITQGLKYAVARERPDGGRYSFPSGHTSAMFVTATVIQQRFGWQAGVAAYAVGVYVGAARLGERQHYLSDVIFGAALGTVTGRAVALAHKSRAPFVVTALPLKGGFAVVFSR